MYIKSPILLSNVIAITKENAIVIILAIVSIKTIGWDIFFKYNEGSF